jgi:hypothetical protein
MLPNISFIGFYYYRNARSNYQPIIIKMTKIYVYIRFNVQYEVNGAFIEAKASRIHDAVRRNVRASFSLSLPLATFEGISSPNSVTCFANWFDRERISPRSRFPRAVGKSVMARPRTVRAE